ncbi:hypothetical protein FNJ84_01415 [Paracoccus sp. M683]|uniref:hypothetical protein n=1 Tax=Paracoccus sp. M683 TaxID=2594268 RepID=UPI00117C43C3|nr:hypothetical protein [Paracoccus sp. M683]TRW99360.1 hypothetical protein FNJ84_01415 [Paracoccus sp. M683]
MSTRLAIAAVLAALAPAAVLADSVTLTAPNSGATLQGEAVDMSVYFTDGADGAYEVVATYVSDAAPGEPQHLIMALGEGDDVSFSLPGHAGTLYNFQRDGGILTVTGQATTFAPLNGS